MCQIVAYGIFILHEPLLYVRVICSVNNLLYTILTKKSIRKFEINSDSGYKQCFNCKKIKYMMEFYQHTNAYLIKKKNLGDKKIKCVTMTVPTLHSYCKECWYIIHSLFEAKKRADKRGLKFDLEFKDIIVPNYCHILGIQLVRGSDNHDNSPSIDRIDNTKGYTKDNIIIISNRANRIKNDSTTDELEKITLFYKNIKKST